MSSLPPVGGATRRSLFAVWAAAVVSLANRHFAVPPRCNRSPLFSMIVGGRRQPLVSSVSRQAALPTARVNFGDCASAVAGLQGPT
jgi:hypothetical protein